MPEAMISRLGKDGVSGIEIVCEMFTQIHGNVDGIHIMALGVVDGTHRIVEFTRPLE